MAREGEDGWKWHAGTDWQEAPAEGKRAECNLAAVTQRCSAVGTPAVQYKHQEPLIVTLFGFFCAFAWAQSKCCRNKMKAAENKKNPKTHLSVLLEGSEMCIPKLEWFAFFPILCSAGPLPKRWQRFLVTWLLFLGLRWVDGFMSAGNEFCCILYPYEWMHRRRPWLDYRKMKFWPMQLLLNELARLKFPFVCDSPDLINCNYFQACVIKHKKQMCRWVHGWIFESWKSNMFLMKSSGGREKILEPQHSVTADEKKSSTGVEHK